MVWPQSPVHLQVLRKLGNRAVRRTPTRLWQPIPIPRPFLVCPARIRTILPVVCVLQMVVVVVLPRTETSLTLLGPRLDRCTLLLAAPALKWGILLTISNGVSPTLWTRRPVLPVSSGLLSARTIRRLVIRLQRVLLRPVAGTESRLLVPTALTELASEVPPRALQFIITTLLTPRVLLLRAISSLPRLGPIPTARAPHFKKDIISLPLAVGTTKPLLKLAMVLFPRLPYPIRVLTIALLFWLTIPFPTKEWGVRVTAMLDRYSRLTSRTTSSPPTPQRVPTDPHLDNACLTSSTRQLQKLCAEFPVLPWWVPQRSSIPPKCLATTVLTRVPGSAGSLKPSWVKESLRVTL